MNFKASRPRPELKSYTHHVDMARSKHTRSNVIPSFHNSTSKRKRNGVNSAMINFSKIIGGIKQKVSLVQTEFAYVVLALILL